MFLIIIRLLYIAVCAGAIATFVSPGSNPPSFVVNHELTTFFVLLGITQLVTVGDLLIPKKRIEFVSAIYFGLLVGVLLSFLMLLAVEPVFAAVGHPEYLGGFGMLSTLTLTYMCTSMLMQTKDDFRFVIPYVEFAHELKGGKPLILDSSALIDGRIADVIETKILDAQMVVPEFILQEVQDIADSNDKNRRTRGRRGLDVLAKLQESKYADISVYHVDSAEDNRGSVDQRLVMLAKELGGRVLTNDFNLNKVASVQGVDVINLNDVANSLKPRYLPGDHVHIKVIKEGESAGQGVGYLDDGTMVVCEQAGQLVGKDIDVSVTSVLQSSAGRMIFARQASSA